MISAATVLCDRTTATLPLAAQPRPPPVLVCAHSFSAQSTNDSLERRWRDGSLELDLPVQVRGGGCVCVSRGRRVFVSVC